MVMFNILTAFGNFGPRYWIQFAHRYMTHRLRIFCCGLCRGLERWKLCGLRLVLASASEDHVEKVEKPMTHPTRPREVVADSSLHAYHYFFHVSLNFLTTPLHEGINSEYHQD